MRQDVAYFVIVHLCCYSIGCENEPGVENITSELLANDTDHDNFTNRKWISQLFYEARMAFRMDSSANADCKKDFDLFTLHVNDQSTWAVKMMESSEWPLVGILFGKVDHMGSYDECLSISSYGITGRYCLAEATFDYTSTPSSEIVHLPEETVSAWHLISMFEKNPARKRMKTLKFATCIPSSCKPNDLENSLNNTLVPLFKTHGLEIKIDVNPIRCSTSDDVSDYSHSRGFFIVGFFLSLLFLLVILSTLHDLTTTRVDYEMNDSSEDRVLVESKYRHSMKNVSEIFSLIRNFAKLKKSHGSEDPSIDCAKFINMLIIVYGHHLAFIIGFPTTNSTALENMYTFPAVQFAHASVVDVFFYLSGFLIFHTGFSSMMKYGKRFLFYFLLVRWIRMVPVFGVLMLYFIYIFPYTGYGPMWNYNVMNEVAKCEESWWASLLAINNIVKTDQQCLIVSWYISTDIQLTIIGAVLLYIFTKNEKFGIFATIVSCLVSIATTFAVTYTYNLYGIFRWFPDVWQTYRTDEHFTKVYAMMYSRCAPYLLGFIDAYVVKLLKEKAFKLTNVQIYSILLIFLLICEGSQFYSCLFYVLNRRFDKFENALYAALHRSVYVLFYAVCGCLYFTSGLGVFTKFVQHKIWIPLGRLSYSVFLINTVVLFYFASCQKEPVQVSGTMNVLRWFCGDILWCYFVGLILHLFVEAPILNTKTILKKLLLKPASSNPIRENCRTKEISNLKNKQ